MSLMTLVRNAISESHNEIEETAFSVAMMDGSMGKEDYARGLSQLRQIHFSLECAIRDSTIASPFFRGEMVRTATIDRDLHSLGLSRYSFTLLPQTTTIIDQITRWGITEQAALLGCLYVLEGSRMGSLVIAKPLAKTLGLAAGSVAGIEYHTEGGAQTPMRVRQLKEQLDQAQFDDATKDALKNGAVVFMRLLNALYAVLPVGSTEKPATAGKCPFSHGGSQAHNHLNNHSQLKSA